MERAGSVQKGNIDRWRVRRTLVWVPVVSHERKAAASKLFYPRLQTAFEGAAGECASTVDGWAGLASGVW